MGKGMCDFAVSWTTLWWGVGALEFGEVCLEFGFGGRHLLGGTCGAAWKANSAEEVRRVSVMGVGQVRCL